MASSVFISREKWQFVEVHLDNAVMTLGKMKKEADLTYHKPLNKSRYRTRLFGTHTLREVQDFKYKRTINHILN